MEELNLPMYRGKSLKTNQYVEGYLKTCMDTGSDVFWIQTKEWVDYQIDPTTLSIFFPSMLDSQATKIFASLSKDGKGGDILESKWFNIDSGLTAKTEAVRWSKSGFCFLQDGYNISRYEYKKVIGIQE